MPEITLVRQPIAIEEAGRDAARSVLFGAIDGLSEDDRKAWRRFWNWFLRKAEPGEMAMIVTTRQRIGAFHRSHMKLEADVYDAQERFTNFDQFRNWLKIGAGHCEWVPGPKGAVVPVPLSIAYSKLDQDGMEKFHHDVIDFLRTAHAQKVLWPHLDPRQRDEMVEGLVERRER